MVVQYLNENSGVALLIATSIYSIASCAMAALMARSNRLASQNIQQVKELESSRTRPYVHVGLERRRQAIVAVVRNTGFRAALHVQISVEPTPQKQGLKGLQPLALCSNTVSLLAPGQSLEEVIGAYAEFLNRYKQSVVEGEVVYTDSQETRFSDVFSIDLALVATDTTLEPHPIADSLAQIAEEIRKLAARNER